MFAYDLYVQLDNQHRDVQSITFDTGRYGQVSRTLTFNPLVSERSAVTAVESWLNQVMSAEDYNNLKDAEDLFDSMYLYIYNWEALGDCHFLESVVRNGNTITIACSS